MPLTPLNSDDRSTIEKVAREVKRGDALTSELLATLISEWEPKVRPDHKETAENFVVARPDGSTTGMVGPRWIFHLLGLRHRAVEIGFHTPSGLIVLQRRSPTKPDSPNAWDMAVAGHLPQNPDGSDLDWEAGAWKEIEEEIGLTQRDAVETLAEGHLIPLGDVYNSFDSDPTRNPPFYNAEVRQLFGGTLTGEGLARLHFSDGEATAILLASPETAWNILAREPVGSGLRFSLPRYLDWLEKQDIHHSLR